MTETLIEKLTKTRDGMRLYQQERAIQELTDLMCELMEDQKISRSELATRLKTTKGYITQLLDGRHNLTVRTISDVFTALNRVVHFRDGSLSVFQESDITLSYQPVPWSEEQPPWGSDVKFGSIPEIVMKIAG